MTGNYYNTAAMPVQAYYNNMPMNGYQQVGGDYFRNNNINANYSNYYTNIFNQYPTVTTPNMQSNAAVPNYGGAQIVQGNLWGNGGFSGQAINMPAINSNLYAQNPFYFDQTQIDFAKPDDNQNNFSFSDYLNKLINELLGYMSGKDGQLINQKPQENPLQDLENFLGQNPINFEQETIEFEPREKAKPLGAWGDPHFSIIDSNGKRRTVDHKGIDGHSYNILDLSNGSDGLKVNARYAPSGDKKEPQIMDKVRVKAGNDRVVFDKNGNLKINGKKVDKDVTLSDGTKVDVKRNGTVDILSKDGDGKINLSFKKGKRVDINTDFKGLDNGDKKIGGILGIVKESDGKISEKDLKKEVENQQLDLTAKRTRNSRRNKVKN